MILLYVCRLTKNLNIIYLSIYLTPYFVHSNFSSYVLNAGGIPYAHVSNELLLKYLVDGNRLQWPEICSEELYKLMRRCWLECPNDRPFFAEIVQLLEEKENNSHLYVNFDNIASNYVFPPTMPVESEQPNKINV